MDTENSQKKLETAVVLEAAREQHQEDYTNENHSGSVNKISSLGS